MENNLFDSSYKSSYEIDNFSLKTLKEAIYDFFWIKHITKKNRKRHICHKIFFKIKK